jgi:hypothetical protein
MTAQRAADQQVCLNSSLRLLPDRDELRQDPWSEWECGITAVIRRGGHRRLVRLNCQQLDCPRCGPRLRLQRVQHFVAMIGDTFVVERTIAYTAWASYRRSIAARPATKTKPARPAHQYLRFDTGTNYLVLATGGIGQPVERPHLWLHHAYATHATHGRVTSSRAWALARGATPSQWELEGVSGKPMPFMVQTARDLDVYDKPLHGADDVHLLRTDPAEWVWAAFRQKTGLHYPDHHRRTEPPIGEQQELAA